MCPDKQRDLSRSGSKVVWRRVAGCKGKKCENRRVASTVEKVFWGRRKTTSLGPRLYLYKPREPCGPLLYRPSGHT